MDDDIYKVVELMNDRITDLSKSYRILNDSHRKLEVGFTEMKAKLDVIGSLIKFFITPGMALLIIAQLARLAGVSV